MAGLPEEEGEEEGEPFGPYLPPLSQHLRENILKKYPDSGQILKELIQNADDAGATEVSFLLDLTDYNTLGVTCKYPELQQYQGPALYAFNNGIFTEQDWKGILATEQGAKRKDPFLIGRFGLGFNSVYHITDVPSVMSGDYIAILNPLCHPRAFRQGGRRYKITYCQRYAEFLPFLNTLDKLGQDRHYPHTLFRFPLRIAPSDLSDTIYTPTRMRERFAELLVDRDCLLLFLKSIEKVTVKERDDPHSKTVVFTAITKSHGNRNQWARFLDDVSIGKRDVESCQLVTIRTENAQGQKMKAQWLVKNKVFDLVNMEEEQLCTRQGVIPWVGVAMKAHEPPKGRVFCFLPLPSDPENSTGLPVHVQGYFGLSDNRRSVTWESSDHRDDTTEWNALLLTRLIPKVYAELLKAATEHIEESRIMPSLIYDSWPHQLSPRWQEILSQFAVDAIELSIFHTKASNGQWIYLSKIYANDIDDISVKEAVDEILLGVGVNVATLPGHVQTAIAIGGYKPITVSPSLVRATLKRFPALLSNISWHMKLHLLEYTMSDSSYKDMSGLQLLPLKSKEFVHFRDTGIASDVYLSSERHPASLLPCLNQMLVDDEINPTLSHHLTALARTRVTQVRELTPDDVVRLLTSALPQGWCNESLSKILWQPDEVTQPPLTWLETIWKWIAQEFPKSLTKFESVPLLPPYTLQSKQIVLFSLRKFGAMMKQGRSTKLNGICAIMEKVGVNLLHTPLAPYISHSRISDYVVSPTPTGVLSVLEGREALVDFVLNREEKVLLRGFLAKIEDGDLMEQHKIVLRSLPILECQKSTYPSAPTKFTSAKCISVALPNDDCPEDVPLNRWLLSSRDSSSVSISRILKLHKLTLAELLIEDVLPIMPALPSSTVQNIMIWVLDRLDSLQMQKGDIISHVKRIAFVTRRDGKVAKPSELFDPTPPQFQDLFAGENVFPTGAYCTEPHLSRLRMLGLKNTLTTTNVVTSAGLVSKMEPGVAIIKAKTVLRCISRKTSCFTGSDQRLLEGYEWMPCRRESPDGYPAELGWFGENVVTATPDNVVEKAMMSLVGSTMPILDGEPSEEFKSVFKWPKPPPVNNVVQHLQSVIQTYISYMSSTPSKSVGALTDMIIQIYQHFADRQVTRQQLESEVSRFDLTDWVWHGSGFTSPERVAVSSDMTFDLSPYLFVLPTQLPSDERLRKFFLQMGVFDTWQDEHVVRVLHDIQGQCGDGESLSQSQLELSMKIINFLTKNCSQACALEGLLVPTHDEDGKTRLVPPKDCMYCDSDWLREKGHNNQMGGSFRMLHQSISPKMANLLGIQSLTHRLVQPTALRPGMRACGQREPITRRIKTIIDEYKEGSGIFYELIQNADDAGATEVKFAVDWRQNSGSRKSLFSSGMAAWQGPALWAYNNKVFTDEDMQNINEISGATKKRDTSKIGRFGLGFNSVYHITDMPSFISRHYFVCFDPHKTHLGPVVNDNDPAEGVQVEWNRDEIRNIYRDQFAPFNGIFDCNIFDSDTYPATLFRFPFRTEDEAEKSQISSTVYDRKQLFKLLTHFAQNLDSLLLFTQHVRSVTVVEIDEEGVRKEMMQVKSTVAPLIKKSPSHRPEDQPPYLLQTASSYMEGQQTKRPPEVPSILKDVFVEVIDSRIATESGTRINKRWLISSCIGSAESFRMAQTEQGKKNGLLPCASVAACLDADTNLPISVVGNAFCFLPLPEFTGLPIHMNAPFAIFSNRQGICKRSGSGIEQSMEVEWNKCLLRDAIPTAYLTLLQHLTLIQGNSASLVSDPFRIWPNISRVEEALYRDNLIPCFYEQAVRSPSKVLLSLDQNWISIEEATFLHPSLRDSVIGEEALQILNIWIAQQRKVGRSTQGAVDIPSWVFEGLQTCKDPGPTSTAFTLNTIYSEVFYPAVKQGYLANHRLILDSFVLHLLDVIFDEISKEKDISFTSLQHLPCVPSSPQGTLLRCPFELVRPDSKVGKLFDEDDQRFPFGAELKKPRRSKSLRRLGMMEKSLPWEILWERVKSFDTWYPDIDQALKRMSYLYKFVVGTPALIKDVTNMTHLARTAVKHLVMVAEKPPTDQNSQSSLPTFCHAIYELLQTTSCKILAGDKDGKREKKCIITDDVVRKTLIDIPFIYITKDGNFVRTRDLAFRNHGRAMTVLRTVPDELEPYRTFLRSCGVKEFFEAVDFVGALKRMAGKYGCRPLEESDLQDSLALAHNLEREHIQRLQSNRTGVEMSLRRQVFLPDREKVLRAISQLAYNDATWLPEDPSITYYVHPQIPREQAVQFFGVETVTSKLFDQTAEDFCDIGEDFGQTEEMTDRIKGILESYSTGMDIFKELLQNADDAGATEVKFIYDTRGHSDERIFGIDWKPLQGPALLVYNNKTFSQSDIEAIQKVGKGNKQEKGSTIGQFGVGFNAVYHLTDCPSFITDSDVMCIFDPHDRYVPRAKMRKPGGRLFPVKDLEDKFPDVLKTFIVPNEGAPLKRSTLFRFPLRTKEMPVSKITDILFPPNDMNDMMTLFWKEANQSILFLNNIEKIVFATIKGNDSEMQTPESYVENCAVRKTMLEKAQSNRSDITNHIKKHSEHVKNKSGSAHGILSIPPVERTYQVVTEDTHDNEKTVRNWLISERVGFNKRPDLHAEQLSFARLKCIMPRVAVAALFDETRLDVTNAVQSLQTSDKLSGQVFCYLPLPTPTTCLPVHVNGHFALDPSRRNLASSGLGGKWNELLKTQLLAPACVSLMVESLSQVLSEGFQLRQYCSLFPVVNEEAEAVSFNALAAEVYRIIANRDENLLPVVVDTDNSSSVTFEKPSDCLFEVDGDVIDDDASETQRCVAKKTLLSIGCKVVETKYMGCIYNNFKHACIDVINFSPLSTVQWLQSQDLECVRNSCLIEDAEGLKNILSYCLSPVRKQSHNLNDCLHDVPLLLAQDKNLYRFNKDNHAYISTYHALVSAKYTYLFVHESLLEMLSKVLLQDPTGTAVKYLDIQDLASLATSHPDIVPDECLAQTTGHNSWRPDETLTRPTAEWIKLLWTFIDEKAKYGHSLHPIKYWQIIPSTRPSLFSLANAKLTFTTDTQVSPTVLDILKKLHCPFIDEGLLRVNVIDKNLASPASSKDVITVLEGVMNDGYSLEGTLDKVECAALLQHLQRDADDLLRSTKLGILRKLPVFETLDGILRCISGVRKVLALSTNANTSQLNINALLEPTGCVVLKFNPNLVKLYEVLEVTEVNQVILYVQHILPAFHLVSNSEQRMSYLTHIKDHLLPSLSTQSPQRYELLQKLQTTAFIANIHGKLFTADQFYNLNEPLFVVAQEHVDFIRFPPQPFCDDTWLDFLHDVGLHTKMDPHHFLRCARTVEEKLRGKWDEDSTSLELLAREVVTYLFRHVNDLLTVLEEVSETRFIPCHHPSQRLTDIQPSADKDAVCFRGSVTSDQESLVWTTSLALPEWARPPSDDVTRLLGVLDRPPLKDVIDNCVNICSKQDGKIARSNLCQVMESIYQFLQESCAEIFGHCFEGERPPSRAECDNCQLINQKLCTVPCVIVEVDSSQSFAVGSRVVFEMSPENKAVFEGYLYRPYRRLSPYEQLFKCLGATESVTLAKYALILSELVNRFGSDSLHEDALPWKVACAAVVRIVELSCGDNGPEQWLSFMSQTTQPILYLPSEENTLEPSQNIVILDGKNHNVEDLGHKRLTNWLKLSRVAVESIPKQFRPVFLSDITEEKFSELSTPCEDGARCPFRSFYDKTLRDVEFCRLLALSISTGEKSMDKSELIPKVRDGLANIRLHCYTTIELELFDLQNVGTSSKGKAMQVCLSSVKSASEDSTCLNMFLKHNAIFEESRICMSFNLQLAKALCNVFPEYDMDLGNVLEELMQRQPTKDTLDKIRYEVLQNTGYGYSLGSSVEELCIISFRPDINLKEGNIVAYRLPSAGKGENVFQAIFAKVVKELYLGALPMDHEEHEVAKVPTSGEKLSLLQTEGNTEQAQANVTLDFERIFEIDANRDENLLVKVTEMYSLDKEQAVQVMERAEAMQHVTQVLEEAWDLEEDDHKRVVGRLYLYWHPKSNPSDEDYAQQVIGHIRDEIKRMLREDDEYIKEFEADIPRPRRSHSRRRSGRKRTGRNREMSDYDKMFNQLDDLTITKTTQGGGHASGGFYEERFQYSSDESQRQRTRLSPDYGEARRWFRQAQTDFASARLCEQHRYYSSAASMCHQAAEKALKAAGFAVHGSKSFDHRLDRLASNVAEYQSNFCEVVRVTYDLSSLHCNNISPRYPDQWASPTIPADAYRATDISSMLNFTGQILTRVSSLIP
ncbi:sacsin-like [Branchiostoma floridae]|uniref:Sacsin-like n=1 Tax=Branchiostoma floridae TaxID=7739 RepID=A0A9J7N475_BRAFL|nr:sacsin-like [Branchiostoma floridae]